MLGFRASFSRVVPKASKSCEQRILCLYLLRVFRWHSRLRQVGARRRAIGIAEHDARPIGAARQRDANGIVTPVGVVIDTKLLAQATGFDADDGIGHRVERVRAPEDFKCDAIAFEALATSSEGLVNNVLQKPLTAPRLNERGALQYAA
jgi:hypothetical protein